MHEVTLESIKKSKGKLIVEFTAKWCSPCKQMEPIVEKLTKELGIPLVKVNMEKPQLIAIQLNVKSLPTFILFKDGREVARRTGFVVESKIKELLWS